MAVWTGKVALTTGVTGRDGTYLAEFLRSKGYVVHGSKSTAARREPSLAGDTRRASTHW